MRVRSPARICVSVVFPEPVFPRMKMASSASWLVSVGRLSPPSSSNKEILLGGSVGVCGRGGSRRHGGSSDSSYSSSMVWCISRIFLRQLMFHKYNIITNVQCTFVKQKY